MEITINEQVQRFYLASTKRWVPVVGHEIRVGKYSFSACPIGRRINVSEVTTGMKFFEIPLTDQIYEKTEFKEGAFDFFLDIGESLKQRIERIEDFDSVLTKMQEIAVGRLGEKPPTQDEDWMLVEKSEFLH